MSKIESEIKQIREELKSIKDDLKTYINQNKLTDETSKEYVEALINNVKLSSINEEVLSREYLDFWTCDHCGKHTHEVDYDYLGNGTNHLGCELKKEMEEDSGTSDFIPAENNGEVKHFADGFHDGEWERD